MPAFIILKKERKSVAIHDAMGKFTLSNSMNVPCHEAPGLNERNETCMLSCAGLFLL